MHSTRIYGPEGVALGLGLAGSPVEVERSPCSGEAPSPGEANGVWTPKCEDVGPGAMSVQGTLPHGHLRPWGEVGRVGGWRWLDQRLP